MKQFRNHGWKYLEQMEDIVPSGGANGVRSSYRGTTGIPAAVSGTDTPGSVTSVTGDVPPVASAGSATASILPPLPAPLPASPVTAVGSNSSKRPYSMMSPDVTNPSDPSLLFSPPVRPPSSISLPSVSQVAPSQGPSKRGKTTALKDDKRSNVVAINMVNNSIQTLNDTIATQFRDKLTVISSATDQLYQIPGFETEHIVELGEYFSQNESKASVFISLRQEERIAYAFKLYNQLCGPNSQSHNLAGV